MGADEICSKLSFFEPKTLPEAEFALLDIAGNIAGSIGGNPFQLQSLSLSKVALEANTRNSCAFSMIALFFRLQTKTMPARLAACCSVYYSRLVLQ
jgi:hypothetical protein